MVSGGEGIEVMEVMPAITVIPVSARMSFVFLFLFFISQ